jgi:hypothetical protein
MKIALIRKSKVLHVYVLATKILHVRSAVLQGGLDEAEIG